MSETVAKGTATNAAAEKRRRHRPKDLQDMENQASHYARKYMVSQAANTNVRVQTEIDEVTRRVIDAGQELFAAQNVNKDVTSLKQELAILQSERKSKKEHLIFLPMKKSCCKE